jgi:16S rRNA (guanine527-N7)-methyltransferase
VDALRRALAAIGLALEPEALDTISAHAQLVVAANRYLNLTRITDPEELAVRHVADCLACLLALPSDEALSLIDVGSGAGYPGIVLAAARPAWRVTLVESARKKATFLESAVHELGLAERVTVLCARAEEAGQDRAHRERHDAAVARAVAPLPVLAEYLLPLVRRGGVALAMRGHAAADEVAAAAGAIALLGGEGIQMLPYELPGLDAPRHLVVLKKRRATPALYPRRPGVAAHQPLA